MHTYGDKDGNTWEESVSCQHGDIKPSYIEWFMNPLLMQITSNIVLTFTLRDILEAIFEGLGQAKARDT